MIIETESEHPEYDMQLNPATPTNGSIYGDPRQAPRLGKQPTVADMDAKAIAPFSLGNDISFSGFAAEVSAPRISQPLNARLDISGLQEDAETELQPSLDGHNIETPELRKSGGLHMIEPQALSSSHSIPTGSISRPDKASQLVSPEMSDRVDGRTQKISKMPQLIPETTHSTGVWGDWKVIPSLDHAQASISDPLQTAAGPRDGHLPSNATPTPHRASAPLDTAQPNATQLFFPTATNPTPVGAVVQTTLTPPLPAGQGVLDPAPLKAMGHSATEMPEAKPVAMTPGTTSYDPVKVASKVSVSDDPAQSARSERLPQDGWSRSEAKTTQTHASPSLSFTATPAIAGSPNLTTLSAHSLDDPSTTVETFIVPDKALPDMNTPQFRDAGLSAAHARSSPELPRLIAAQLADVVRSNSDKPVELTLNPEELGRVRMSFQTEASSLNVIVQVERPETLDLMRRHIEQLAQDMHALGYDDVSFSFRQQQQDTASGGQSQQPGSPPATVRNDAANTLATQDVVQIQVGETTGIDIRI